MSALAKIRMSVDEFLAWAMEQPGRHELYRGEVFAMSPETVGHAKIKAAAHHALAESIKQRRLPCHSLPDGMTVRIDANTAFEPDALVYCGKELAAASIEVPEPVIIVEVLSPSTRQFDVTLKLAGYFKLASVKHYLIVDPGKPLIIHHARGDGETILTRIVTEGAIMLDPPGIELALDEIYGS